MSVPSVESPTEESSNETPVEQTGNEPEPRRGAPHPVLRYEPQW